MNCRVVLALISLAFSITLHAEGLSWTDPNKDTACDAKVSSICSSAEIQQIDGVIVGTKIYTLHIFFALYPVFPDNGATTMDLTIVTETQDRLKHTYKQQVPIETETTKNPNGSSTTIRYCIANVDSIGQGVITVWSIDAIEKRGEERILFHKFR